jgi:hypothetical protein
MALLGARRWPSSARRRSRGARGRRKRDALKERTQGHESPIFIQSMGRSHTASLQPCLHPLGPFPRTSIHQGQSKTWLAKFIKIHDSFLTQTSSNFLFITRRGGKLQATFSGNTVVRPDGVGARERGGADSLHQPGGSSKARSSTSD